MPSRTAFRLCPQAVFLPARFEVYRAVSAHIMQNFHTFTDLVEPLPRLYGEYGVMKPGKSRHGGVRNVRNVALLSCTLYTLHPALTSFTRN